MASFFQGASHIDARRGHLTAVQNQYNIQHANFTSYNDPVLAALNPVTSSYVQPCMPGTRQWMIDHIHDWLRDHQAPNILWLSGSPGAGKSTIASTLVSNLQEAGRLGSSFFCKRDDIALSDPAACWRTIAFDLAQYDPVIAKRMVENIKGRKVDPGRADIELHFKYLIEDPLREVWRSRMEALAGLPGMEVDDEGFRGTDGETNEIDEMLIMGLPILVIDALDECGSDGFQSTQRQTFIKTITKWSHLPKAFKLVVTSRDDRIPQSFRAVCHRMILNTGDVAGREAINDVHVFIETRFAAIAAQNYWLSPTWPGESTIKQLTSRAAGLFVWADTVVKFVEQGIPNMRLNSILQDRFHYGEERLDGLYRQVMNLSFHGATDDELELFKLVVGAVVLAKIPLRRKDLRYFLGRDEEEASIAFILLKLSSVISTGTADDFIHISHLSFAEFICDSQRCGELFAIHHDAHNQIMALACLQVMRTRLRFNICQLETSHIHNVDVPDLASRIEKLIPTRLSYSCCFWSDHLQTAKIDDDVVESVKDFLHTHLLHWLEVLSLIKEVNIASQVLMSIRTLIGAHDEDLNAFARDAGKFVSMFGSVISQSAPHIYISALPFAPTGSRIARRFLPLFTGVLSFQTDRSAEWPKILNVLEGHTGAVRSVAFSHDGEWIVSGSHDCTIRVWDAETGEVFLGPLEHPNWVNSVAFSPDGQRVASGSSDNMIHVWDTETGDVISGPFEGHTDEVSSVAFSPDGQRIVSGSYDKTIRVWDAETGNMLSGPFEGHTGKVNSVTFSPDGRHILSGSQDHTICVWHAKTGEVILGPLAGHKGWVFSIGFSPDGNRIVSGSYDHTIRVWDTETGDVVSGPFEGHTRAVSSVSFSPDGQRIVSASWDCTIRVWDTETGDMLSGPFEGHTDWVRSVTFSPDGLRILSGSDDRTIRVWDAEIEEVVSGPFNGHTNEVTSVAFSQDGKYIVSGSCDRTVCVWDADTGEFNLGPLAGHIDSVWSVAFSPDGNYIISGSVDNTIRVWDAHTGETVLGPLEGHTAVVWSVAFSPDGNHIVSGSDDKTIRIWDMETGDVILGPLEGHTDAVTSVMFSPDGNLIASGSDDDAIRIWDAQTGHLVLGPLVGHSFLGSVAFSPDCKHIVSGSWDDTIRVWDADAGELVLGPLEGHTNGVLSVAFSPDGNRIVSGSWDKTIRIWNVETGDVILGPLEAHTSPVSSVMFSPDGNRIVSGSDDKTIRVWDVKTSDIITPPIPGHSSEMENVHNTRKDTPRKLPGFEDAPEMVDGWIIGSNSELLFWVPPSIRDGLWWPRSISVISASGSTKLDFTSFCHGKSWTQCRR